jgi:RND family efflux transporter MFP subunit
MVALALLAGCSGQAETAAPAPGASAPAPGSAAASAPPVSVTTVRAQRRDLPQLLATTGTVTPLSSVDVKPQVTSQVTAVLVREGQFVRAGELLFTLDARTDEANVAKALAQLVRDEAGLADAKRQLARSRELLAQNFVSQGAVDTNLAQVDGQAALLAADRAALEAARVALSYARIVAPGAGRVGAIGVYPGSAVQATLTTLVTITQLDPIAVAFSLPQSRLPEALAALKGRGSAVSATLPEGGGTVRGRLQFVDNGVDASTGTVKVKAQFDNREGRLWPGAYVNVEMTAGTLAGAVVVPQAAIIRSARGTLVYAVQDGKAVARPVQLVYAQGDDAAVTGVQPGERIVLDGRQNLRPDTPVFERAGAAPGRAAPAASGSAAGSAAGSATGIAAGADAPSASGAARRPPAP